MSVYVLRHGNLRKIGYSSNLGMRVQAIMGAVPAAGVEFVGHMPGDREVEAHLHAVFASTRFSGEWFVDSAALQAFCDTILIKELPAREYPGQQRKVGVRRAATEAWAEQSRRIREAAALRWPVLNHQERVSALREHLGWTHRRVRSLYNCDVGGNLRQIEIEDLDALFPRAALVRPGQRSATGSGAHGARDQGTAE